MSPSLDYHQAMSGKKRPAQIPEGAPGHPRKSHDGQASPKAPRQKAGTGPRRSPRPTGEARHADGPRTASAGRPQKAGGRGRGPLAVLYEDGDLIAVVKPEGLPVISAEGSRARSLYDLVTDHIRRRNPRGRAAVVHRLDRESSGVLVFAKSAGAKKTLMSRWDELAEERLYVALAEGTIEGEEGRFDSWLAPSGESRVRAARPGERGALRAVTDWRVLGRGNGYTLVELALETGRKHQIRAQLAAAGHPIAGDSRYGSRRDPAGRLCLHATALALRQPFTGELLRFEEEAPADFAAALREPTGPLKGPSGSPRPPRRGAGTS